MPLNVGEVSVSSKGVHWTIPNFSQLQQIHNTRIRSPSFQFENKEWYLSIYLDGHRHYYSLVCFGIGAWMYTPFRPIECDIHLGIADEQGRSIVSSRAVWYNYRGYKCLKLISHEEFQSRKNEFMPDGTLHILLSIENEEPESTFHADVNEVEDGKKRKQKYDHESQDVSTQFKEAVGRKKFKQSHDDASKEVSVQTDKEKETWSYKQKFEKMLLNESITDIVLKVQDKEFRAHRFMLAAHSPVFLAMMSHDNKEKLSGVIDIEDGDPKAFPDFLQFLYTGIVENLTSEKAVKLYTVADKYEVNELKESCLDHLLTNISVDNFCDVITFSLQHNEILLKDSCIQFFLDNSLDIITTVNWQTFLRENSTVGNELFIKHVQMVKSKYCEK